VSFQIIVFFSCAPKALLVIRSEPQNARIYKAPGNYVGTTPCRIKLNELPKDLAAKGQVDIGEFTAYNENFPPVTKDLKLELNDSNQITKKKLFRKSLEWHFLFELDKNDSSAPSNSLPRFFACNYWIDRNQDSQVSADEVEGIKDYFQIHETITFVAIIEKGAGVHFSYTLVAPDGSIYLQDTETARYDKCMRRLEFKVRELISEKDSGVWRMFWRIEDKLVAITKVSLST
jgi:hypothetical protein